MTSEILKSWDPHTGHILNMLRRDFRIVARQVDGEPPEAAKVREINVEGIKRNFNRLFYKQFKNHAEYESYLDNALKSPSTDLDAVTGREFAAIRDLRLKMPYGTVHASTGPVFAEPSAVKGELRDYSGVLKHLMPDISKLRHTNVICAFERTANAFNVCLVATQHNTVRDHAEEFGRDIYRAKERSILGNFGRKPLNIFRFIPSEESAIAGSPDRLVQLVEKGARLENPIFYDMLPRRLDEIWTRLSPYLDYVGHENMHLKIPPSAHTEAHRSFRNFTLGL
jgi:hypothetical protein